VLYGSLRRAVRRTDRLEESKYVELCGVYRWSKVAPSPSIKAVGSQPFGVQGDPNQMSLRPLHDRVLIKRIEEQETVKGGIIIPDTAKEKSQEGEVVASGPGKILENGSILPLDVKAGDRILFGKYSGAEVRIANQDYLILREDEIIGILNQNGKAAGKK
jgi:chaperonin GroES